ncbi:hypothetical protein M6B38_226455 [Iris pallida]|uniref:Uncharacterized protein n=1 Tax=Iris pallida TaxID=29817 RepID=A0AAX6DUE2_IRIPA|nr:hypothetical protein M6B38_226455 [Iris pallida]
MSYLLGRCILLRTCRIFDVLFLICIIIDGNMYHIFWEHEYLLGTYHICWRNVFISGNMYHICWEHVILLRTYIKFVGKMFHICWKKQILQNYISIC